MILGSHNSLSYLPVKKWWMKPLAFTARCQRVDIKSQYDLGVRCFDIRVRYDKDGNLIVAHGIIEYAIKEYELLRLLSWIDTKGDCMVRVLNEVRTKKQRTEKERASFRIFCSSIAMNFRNIRFWCGRNLYDWQEDFDFGFYPSCEEKYASVCSPKLIDDWWPFWFAKFNNKQILKDGSKADVLLMDFIDINSSKL